VDLGSVGIDAKQKQQFGMLGPKNGYLNARRDETPPRKLIALEHTVTAHHFCCHHKVGLSGQTILLPLISSNLGSSRGARVLRQVISLFRSA